MKEQPIVVFEDEDVSFTLESIKDLGILFFSTLSWIPPIEKRIHVAYGHLSISHEVSQVLSQVNKKLLPTKPTFNHSYCMTLKSGSQIRQTLRNSKKALLPGGCLVRLLIKAV